MATNGHDLLSVSLSLRFSYRELRLSKIPFFQARFRRQLLARCALLRELGELFPATILMVDLAEQTVREVDKVFSATVNTTPNESTNRQQIKAAGALVAGNAGSRGQTTLPDRERQSIDSGEDHGGQDDLERQALHADQDPGDFEFDPSVLGAIPDWDVFAHLDPDFNLGAVDATLGGDLTPSYLCFKY